MKSNPIHQILQAIAGLALAGVASLFLAGCQSAPEARPAVSAVKSAKRATHSREDWRGIHLGLHSDRQVDALIEQLPALAAIGVNVLVIEVDYSFDFRSHPELKSGEVITRARARSLAAAAAKQRIRLIPQINCLGHQSWAKNTGPLLKVYPQFDETPGQYPENAGIYCRSWCPLNPEVNAVVFALIDELMDAFQATAFHAGMDEVFTLGSEHCPRCAGKDPGELFARAVNNLHHHVVKGRGWQMLIWGDRLLDAKALGYSKWEASENGTQSSVDLIPKDIVICDWHYEKRADYPSIRTLADKGFPVWPSAWQPLAGAEAFSEFTRTAEKDHVVGFLCTTWGKVKIPEMATWPPVTNTLPRWK
jgi:hypothetical protein